MDIGKIIESVVADNFIHESLAKKINALTAEEINFFKKQADKAAFELSAEENRIILNGLVSDLLKSRITSPS